MKVSSPSLLIVPSRNPITYYDFGSQRHSNPVISTVGPAVGAPAFYSQDVKTTMSTVTGRISYLFNAGPVVAKY